MFHLQPHLSIKRELAWLTDLNALFDITGHHNEHKYSVPLLLRTQNTHRNPAHTPARTSQVITEAFLHWIPDSHCPKLGRGAEAVEAACMLLTSGSQAGVGGARAFLSCPRPPGLVSSGQRYAAVCGRWGKRAPSALNQHEPAPASHRGNSAA